MPVAAPLPFALLGSMMADRTAGNRSEHRMMSGIVARNASDDGALDAPLCMGGHGGAAECDHQRGKSVAYIHDADLFGKHETNAVRRSPFQVFARNRRSHLCSWPKRTFGRRRRLPPRSCRPHRGIWCISRSLGLPCGWPILRFVKDAQDFDAIVDDPVGNETGGPGNL